jgi:hypothetical protein
LLTVQVAGLRPGEGNGVVESYQGHAEWLADLLVEQLERLGATEHEEAYVLAQVIGRLARRAAQLGEVIEAEAGELDDRSALQMATALQAQCANLQRIVEQIAADPRFGLLPGDRRGRAVRRPPRPHVNGQRTTPPADTPRDGERRPPRRSAD